MDLSNLSCVRSQSWDTYRSIIARSIRRAEKKRNGGGRIFNPFLSDRVSCGTNKLVMVSPRGNKSRRNLSRYYRIKTTLSSTGLQLQFSFDDHDASTMLSSPLSKILFFLFLFPAENTMCFSNTLVFIHPPCSRSLLRDQHRYPLQGARLHA